MPRTRGESIFFTAITAWMMVYVMTIYNTVLAYKYDLSYYIEGNVDRVYHHRIACLFRVRSSLKNVRLPRCPAWRPADFYHLCDPDFHGNLAGCIRQCDRCLSRTWIYRQLYTGLSYDLLQKFYHGISAAAYFCRTACKTDLPDIIYQS